MGSVRFNKQRGAWFVDYIAANGERMRQTIGPGEDGRRLAKKVLVQREAEAQVGIHHLPPSRSMRFGEFADAWIRHARARGLAPKTFETYQDFVEHHLAPAFGETRLSALTRKDIEDFLVNKSQTPRKGSGKKPKVRPPLSPHHCQPHADGAQSDSRRRERTWTPHRQSRGEGQSAAAGRS